MIRLILWILILINSVILRLIAARRINWIIDTKVEVKYGIDRNADSIYLELDVFYPEDVVTPVDCVVITPFLNYDEICNLECCRICKQQLSIEDIIMNVVMENEN